MDEHEFERAIAVQPTGYPGGYASLMTSGWTIPGGAINGGVTLATAANALARQFAVEGPHVDPVCVSAYYLAAAMPGPAECRAEVLRSGASLSTGQVGLWQNDAHGTPVERLRALATFGNLDAIVGDVQTSAQPPELPDPGDCRDLSQLSATLDDTEVMRRYDVLLDPATSGWLEGAPSGRGHMRAWFRMKDGYQPTPLLLLQAVDALPPVAYDLGVSGWVPTLELTVHVRARPVPGWLRISLTTVNFAGGLLEEDAQVWDSSGRLVAQGRQLAKVIRRRPEGRRD